MHELDRGACKEFASCQNVLRLLCWYSSWYLSWNVSNYLEKYKKWITVNTKNYCLRYFQKWNNIENETFLFKVFAVDTSYYPEFDIDVKRKKKSNSFLGARPFSIHYPKIWNIVVTNERETNICEYSWMLSNTAQFISTGIS